MKKDLLLGKKQRELWCPQVDLAINKLNHLLMMRNEHNKVCVQPSLNGMIAVTSMGHLGRKKMLLDVGWIYL